VVLRERVLRRDEDGEPGNTTTSVFTGEPTDTDALETPEIFLAVDPLFLAELINLLLAILLSTTGGDG
jgi:hypothetical protein